MNFSGDLSKSIPIAEINMQAGIQEHRLMHLKKTFEHKELIGIIVFQIVELQEFLNVRTKMTAKQVFDTAEFILDAYEFLSFTSIQDCFNRIKKAESPFDAPLYSSVDGRKIMELIQKYDNLLDDELFGDDLREHKSRLRSEMDNPKRMQEMINKIKKDV